MDDNVPDHRSTAGRRGRRADHQVTEHIVAAARSAGSGFLEAYEKTLQSLADFRP